MKKFLLLTIAAWLFSIQLAFAAIGTPVYLGGQAGSHGCTFTTTSSVTSATVLVFYAGTTATPAATFNSTSMTVAINMASPVTQGVAYLDNVTASSGVTVTVGSSGTIDCNAYSITGLATSSSLDKTASTAATGTSPTVSTGTLSNANEIVVGMFTPGLGTPSGPASGWTALPSFTTVMTAASSIGHYKIVAVTTTVTYNPTTSNGALTSGLFVASFQVPVVAGGFAYPPFFNPPTMH